MRSREDRKRQAQTMAVWGIVVLVILFMLYVLIEKIYLPWILGLIPLLSACLGATLTYLFTWRLRREEERQRRQPLATMLLAEVCLLEQGLFDIYQAPAPADEPIEPLRTAVYDQAGAQLILFKPVTVQALVRFYQHVHYLRGELSHNRTGHIDPGDSAHWFIRLRVYGVLRDLKPAFTPLIAEGGNLPSRTSVEWVSYPEVPELSPVCENTDAWRRTQRPAGA